MEARDFVLSRIFGEPELLSLASYRAASDIAWQTEVTHEIVADPRLSKAQQHVVEKDWGMADGLLRVPTRAALATYCLQLLKLDHRAIKAMPEEQQVVLRNRADLDPWLFSN
jgi:hypothetical protein